MREYLRYQDESALLEERVDDLMLRMTLEEKVGQMCQLDGRKKPKQWVDEHHVGSFLHLIGEPANALQKYVFENTRLGIPLIFGIDAIHGHAFWPTATVFPTQLGVSCSWNPGLVNEMGRITAKETACTGMHWTFSPVLGVTRDLRWGRVDETFGEDPYLAGELGAAVIEGYQGEDVSDPERILACPKHFAGYPGSIGGRDSYEAELTQRSMRSLYLKPFKRAVEAGAATFMTGYHTIDGVSCTANRWLLNDVLKEEWGFEGFVITDWMNVAHMVHDQKVSPNLKDATKQAIQATNDMSMTTEEFCGLAVELVKEGSLDVSLVDDACRRVLRMKFMLGLFDKNRYTDLSKQSEWIGIEEHREAVLEAAYESIVLLKNDDVLPIKKEVKKIAVLGPNADDVMAQLGDWVSWQVYGEADGTTRPRELTSTVLDGIRGQAGDIEVTYDRACSIMRPEDEEIVMARTRREYGDPFGEIFWAEGKGDMQQSVQLAAEADVAVVVVGDNRVFIGENRDRMNLDLSGRQQELLEKVKAKGTPMVVVLINSKPLSIPWVAENADAVIETFNPGMRGGEALAGLLFGERDFTGKLTVSFPFHVGQQPVYYNQLPGWHTGYYVDLFHNQPLYAFGYGLHYTTFEYSDLRVQTPVLSEGEVLKATVELKNTGDWTATEIVQLYINDVYSSVVTPIKELKAFKRINLEPGEKKTVSFEVPFEELALVNADLETVVEVGEFEMMVGSSSRDEDLLKAAFEVK